MQKKKQYKKIFCLLGDAELNEGSVWEAVIFAAKNNLSNLVAMVDYNKIGSSDFSKNYISTKPLAVAWEKLGWKVNFVNGHNLLAIDKIIRQILMKKISKPNVIILDTIKGKGLSFMENDPIWHVKGLDGKLYDLAMKELKGDNAS